MANSPNTNTTDATYAKLPVIKVEPQGPEQSNPSPIVPEWCRWGPNCPICKNAEEDWDSKHQRQFPQTDAQQKYSSQNQDARPAQAQNPQHTKDYQTPQKQPNWTQSFDMPDCDAEQLHLRREWEEKMEQLNEKYRLDCFSDSELDSESDEGENYQYEHKYKTLISFITRLCKIL